MPVNVTDLRVALDRATEGGLHALNRVSTQYGWEPHITTSRSGLPPDYTRFIFFATVDDLICYFDSAVVKGSEGRRLAAEVGSHEAVREAKKATERVRKGLARLDVGLDPED
jgi:hypothetical protein